MKRADEQGQRANQAALDAIDKACRRVDPKDRVNVAIIAASGPIGYVGRLLAGDDESKVDAMRMMAALVIARQATRRPEDPDPRDMAFADYAALVVAGRLPPLDGGGA